MNRYSGTKTKGVSSASGTWVSAGDRPDTRKRKLNPPGDPYWSTVAAETATRTAADPPDGPEHAETMPAQLGVDKNLPRVDLAAYEAANAKPKATDRSQTTVDRSTNFASARSMMPPMNTLHQAKKTKVEHPSVPGDRDILVGDESRKANALLNDMVSLHRMIWKVEDSSKKRKSRHEVEELAAHLVRLIKEGKAFSSQDTSDTNKFFVPGSSSRFMEQIDHDTWVELSDQRAVQFVADKLLDGYSKTITSNPETDATKGKKEGLNAGLLLMAALATAAADGAGKTTNTAATTMKAQSSSSSPPPSTLLSEKKQSSAKAVNPKHNQQRKRNQSGQEGGPDGNEDESPGRGGAIGGASGRKPLPPRHGFDTDGNIVVKDYDILCGRGEGQKQHEGNVRFRNIVALYRPDYIRASKFQKLEVAKLVVQAILQGHPPARFLRQDSETGKWIDIGFNRAAEITSQALREKTAVDERARMRVAGDAPGGLAEPQLSTENELQQERLSAATCPPPSNPVPTPATEIRNAAEAGGRGREKTASAMKNKTADLSYRFSRPNPPNAVDAAGNILVSDYDILCVQEGEPMIMNHNVNNRFHESIALYYPDYASAPRRERPTVAKAVVHAIRNGNPPSRFLEQCHATGQWIDIGDMRAIERVNQALQHMSMGLDKYDGHSPVFLVASEKAEAAMSNTKLLSPPPTPSSRLATTAATAPSLVGNEAETYSGRRNMKQLGKESQCRGSIPVSDSVSDRAGNVTNIAEGKKPASGVLSQRTTTMRGRGVPAVSRRAARGRGGAVLGQYVTVGHSSSAKTISSQALSAKAKTKSLPMAALQDALRIRWEGFAGTDELEIDKLGMAGPSTSNEAVDGTPPVTAPDRQKGSKRSTLPLATKKENPPEPEADNQTTQSYEEKTPSSYSPADDGAEGSIILADNDIVCGTGGIADHPHKGNARFQDILALYLSDYVEAPTSRKPGVAKVIVQAIRNGHPPGRFLKKDAATGKWVDIGYKQAAENTSLALQEMVAKEESNGDGETKAALAGITGVTRPLAIPRPQAEKAVPPPLLPLSATAAAAVAVNDNRNESRGRGRSRDTQPAYYPPVAPTNTFGQPPPPPLQRIAKTFVGGGMAHPQYGNIRPGDAGLFHRPDFSRTSKVGRPTCPPLARAPAARIPPPPLEDRNKQNSSGKRPTANSGNQMPGDATTPGGPNDVAVGQDRSKGARAMPHAMLGPPTLMANLRLIIANQGFIEDAWVRSVAEKALQGLGQRYLKQPNSARQDCVNPSNVVAEIQKKDGFIADKGNDRSMPPMLSTEFVDGEGNIVVTDYDILCGRGGRTNNNEGNKRFRDLVALLRPAYVQASKVEKPKVAKVLVHAILSADPPGRFLRLDAKTGKWVDTGLQRAKEKTSQALREKTVEEREHIRAMASSSDSTRQGTESVPPQPTAYPPPYGMRPPVRMDQRPPPNAMPSAPPPPMWRPAGYPHPQPPGWFPCWR